MKDQKEHKYTCGNCEADTRLCQYPVRSTIYNKKFCDLECFHGFKKKMAFENREGQK